MNINVATEKLASTAPFEVERHGARLGAEIHGLDLKNGLDPETFKAFEAALVEHNRLGILKGAVGPDTIITLIKIALLPSLIGNEGGHIVVRYGGLLVLDGGEGHFLEAMHITAPIVDGVIGFKHPAEATAAEYLRRRFRLGEFK